MQMLEDSAYVRISRKAKAIEQSPIFQRVVLWSIAAAGILVGLQSDTTLNDMFVLKILDWILIGLFCSECGLKVISEREGPFLYFGVIVGVLGVAAATQEDSWLLVGILSSLSAVSFLAFAAGTKSFIYRSWDWAWTVLDLIVTVMLAANPWLVGTDTFPFATLRLLRLLRVHKILKVLPLHMKLVGAGVLGGCWSLLYIGIIFGLLLFLFALAGMYFLQSNDPAHFGSLPLAMLAWFQVCTLEGWTDLMYTSVYGCEEWPVDSTHYIMDTSSSVHFVSDFQTSRFWRPKCTTPEAHLVTAPLLFTAVVLLGGVVMRALLAAAVVMAMTNESGGGKEHDFTVSICYY
jgi:hypothetical protein